MVKCKLNIYKIFNSIIFLILCETVNVNTYNGIKKLKVLIFDKIEMTASQNLNIIKIYFLKKKLKLKIKNKIKKI